MPLINGTDPFKHPQKIIMHLLIVDNQPFVARAERIFDE